MLSADCNLLDGLLREQEFLNLPALGLAAECCGGADIGCAGTELYGIFAGCGLPLGCLLVKAGQGVCISLEGQGLALTGLEQTSLAECLP